MAYMVGTQEWEWPIWLQTPLWDGQRQIHNDLDTRDINKNRGVDDDLGMTVAAAENDLIAGHDSGIDP